jgi:glycosyltransferase involved in cell wall biosynthesis
LDGALAQLGHHVIRTGHLHGTTLSATLLAADLAVLPYADGASPRRGSLLACAAHGLPIISTDPASGLVADAVLTVPPNHPQALAEVIRRVHHDATLAEQLHQASLALHARTSWPRIAADHVTIYAQHLA